MMNRMNEPLQGFDTESFWTEDDWQHLMQYPEADDGYLDDCEFEPMDWLELSEQEWEAMFP
ncbi:MAG: hypothetical protein KatS3mg023_3639 [Armatimonadota bacterium]|nr:MAG: hypothetical protein KatS3mg023_3639 [Armatimonadota bacterium]